MCIRDRPEPPVNVSPTVVPPPEIVSSPNEPISWSDAVPPVIVKSISTVSTEVLTLKVADPTVLLVKSIVIVPVFKAAVLLTTIWISAAPLVTASTVYISTFSIPVTTLKFKTAVTAASFSSWIVSVPAPPAIVSFVAKCVVPSNLKVSSPEPPVKLSALTLLPLSIIKNAPLDTAEPSIVVTLSVVVLVIVKVSKPRLVNVSLPKVRLVVLLPRVIFSIPIN